MTRVGWGLAVGTVLAALAGRHEWSLAQAARDDEEAIRRLVQSHADAWNRRDAKAAAAVYREDADVRTSSGQVLRGRAEIEKAHVEWLAKDAAEGGTIHSHPADTISIRFLRPDVAVADLEARFQGAAGPDGKAPPPDRTLLFIVVVKDKGRWSVAAQRALGAPAR